MTYDINSLEARVKSILSLPRFEHTLGVKRMAMKLGRIYLKDHVDELCVAAILHDITKELSYDDHITLIEAGGFIVTEEDLKTPPILHSISALTVILREFISYASENVLSSVYNHTLGDASMSLFDKIIYLSDYIEDTRKYESSRIVREFLLSDIDNLTYEEQLDRLDKAILMCCEATISHLLASGKHVHSKTLALRDSIALK